MKIMILGSGFEIGRDDWVAIQFFLSLLVMSVLVLFISYLMINGLFNPTKSVLSFIAWAGYIILTLVFISTTVNCGKEWKQFSKVQLRKQKAEARKIELQARLEKKKLDRLPLSFGKLL